MCPGIGIFLHYAFSILQNVENMSCFGLSVIWVFSLFLGLCIKTQTFVAKKLSLFLLCIATDKTFRIQESAFLFRDFPFPLDVLAV